MQILLPGAPPSTAGAGSLVLGWEAAGPSARSPRLGWHPSMGVTGMGREGEASPVEGSMPAQFQKLIHRGLLLLSLLLGCRGIERVLSLPVT